MAVDGTDIFQLKKNHLLACLAELDARWFWSDGRILASIV